MVGPGTAEEGTKGQEEGPPDDEVGRFPGNRRIFFYVEHLDGSHSRHGADTRLTPEFHWRVDPELGLVLRYSAEHRTYIPLQNIRSWTLRVEPYEKETE